MFSWGAPPKGSTFNVVSELRVLTDSQKVNRFLGWNFCGSGLPDVEIHRCHESFRHLLRSIFFHFIPAPIHTSRLCSTRVADSSRTSLTGRKDDRSTHERTWELTSSINVNAAISSMGVGRPSAPHAFCESLPRDMFCRCVGNFVFDALLDRSSEAISRFGFQHIGTRTVFQ